jgi:hypothetical protein
MAIPNNVTQGGNDSITTSNNSNASKITQGNIFSDTNQATKNDLTNSCDLATINKESEDNVDSSYSGCGALLPNSLVRKRCSIAECEEYCCLINMDECVYCDKLNRSMRFCSMHTNHESHKNQQGFIEHPSESTIESNLLSDQYSQDESFQMTVLESRVLRLFEEGFITSSNSNITVSQKIIGAINHATYKGSLGVIARKYKLPISDPAPETLSKEKGRLNYINALISAYSARK